MSPCPVCDSIQSIERRANSYFVAELETGYVEIGWHQFFKGYTVFSCKYHKTELHELEKPFRTKFLEEMSIVAEAVCRAFNPVKMNYELLGNSFPHMHWHLFPKHANDPSPDGPVWKIDPTIKEAESARPTPEQLEELKRKLLGQLESLTSIVRRYSDQ